MAPGETATRAALATVPMLAASSDLVYLCDRQGTILYANLAGATRWGLKRDQILGMSWQQLGAPADVVETLRATSTANMIERHTGRAYAPLPAERSQDPCPFRTWKYYQPSRLHTSRGRIASRRHPA